MPLSDIKTRIRKFSLIVNASTGCIRFLTLFAIALLLYCLLDYFIFLSPAIRLSFLILTLLCGIILAIVFKFNPATELENSFKVFNGRLFASLSDYPSVLGYSEQLIHKTRDQTAKLLKSINLIPQIKKKLMPLSLPLIISWLCIFTCLALLPSPKFTWVKRFFSPNNFFSLTLEPGDKRIYYGDTIEIRVSPNGITPSKIALFANDSHYTLYKKSKFKTSLKVTEDISYYATLGTVSTDTCKISVIIPPSITGFNLTYIHPEYTKIPEFTSTSPEISALYGTEVVLSATSNVNLKSAIINFNSSDDLTCEVADKNIKANFRITRADTYSLSLLAENGLENKPRSYPIKIWNDNAPQVAITFPGADIEMPSTMKVPLMFQARDDYGLSLAKLICSSQQPTRWTLYSVTDTLVFYEWDLSQSSSSPGEVITYWIEVIDNDPFNGPKSAKSREFKIYFPTVEDIYKQVSSELAQTQTETVDELEELSRNLNTIGEQMEDIIANVEQNRTDQIEWRDKQSIENLLQKEKEIEQRINKLSKDLDELYKKAENTIQVDEELTQKIKQLQQLFSELNLPELQSAIEDLKDAINKNPELLTEALKNFKLSQEELKRRIENTIALLEKFKQEQALKSLADRASELQQWQSEINERTASGDSLAQLAEEEDALSKELAQLNKDMKELSEQLKPFSDELNQESARASNIQNKLDTAKRSLSRGQKPLSLQQEISNELSSLASNLYSLHQQMIDQEKSRLTKELQELRNEFLFLSFKEEGLDGSPLDIAFQQSALIKGTKNAGEKLKELSKVSTFIPARLGKYASDAISSMEKLKYKAENLSKTPDARCQMPDARCQIRAMSNLNKIVSALIESENAIKSSSCPCGLPFLMNQLAQLTGRQQNLNMLMQSFLPLNLGSSGLQQQLAGLIQEQQAISQALKQIANGLKGKTLGDLGGAAQEMEKIARDLEKGISQEIVERQKKVLQHLLDAQKSIYTKKYSKQRISEPGENFLSLPSPPLPKLSTKYGISQKEIIDALRKNYPEEYEQLIKAYFHSISR